MQNLLAAFPSILARLGRRRIDEIVAKVAEQRNEAIEQASVDQQRVAGLWPGLRRAEAEVAPGGLVDVVDVLEAGEVTSAGPRIEGLIARIFVRGHQRHRLDDVLADEIVRTFCGDVRASVFEGVELVANREKLDYPLLIGEEDGLAAVDAVGMTPAFPFTLFTDSKHRVIALKVGELHQPELDLILNTVQQVDAGSLSPADARTRISEGLKTLAVDKATGTPAA